LKEEEILLVRELKIKKLQLILPQGAYYAFVKVLTPIDDYAFAMKLLEEAKVASSRQRFWFRGENHVRISFGGDEEKLKEGLERFVNYIEKNA